MTQKFSIKNLKSVGLEDDVREYSKEWAKELWPKLTESCSLLKDTTKYKDKNFYLVLIKRFNPAKNKPESIIIPRLSCPTPVYKQDVFKYHCVSGSLEYLWTIPDKFKYYHILNNKQRYYENKETRRLCQFVVLMETGDLLKWVKKENGEKPDAALSIMPK